MVKIDEQILPVLQEEVYLQQMVLVDLAILRLYQVNLLEQVLVLYE